MLSSNPCCPRVALFRYLDFFKSPVDLTLKKKLRQTTLFGGFLTICMVLFVLAQAAYNLSDIIERRNMQLYQINEVEPDTTALSLRATDNFFMTLIISMDDANLNISDACPFSFETTFSSYMRLNGNSTVKKKFPILWEPCKKSDFEYYGPNTFTTLSLNSGYCMMGVNMTDSDTGACLADVNKYPNCIAPPNFDIKGSFFSRVFDLIQIKVKICDQTDSGLSPQMKCDPSDVREKFKSHVFKVNLYYSTTMVIPTNYHTPNKSVIDTVYWTLNPEIYKLADIFVDKLTIEDFDDYFYTSKTNNRTFFTIQSEKIRQLESIQTKEGSILLDLNIRRSGYNNVVSRTYLKIQQFLAYLGGFAKSIMFVVGFIAACYRPYRYFMTLANELYEFRSTKVKLELHEICNIPARSQDRLSRAQLSSYTELPKKEKPVKKRSTLSKFSFKKPEKLVSQPDQEQEPPRAIKQYFDSKKARSRLRSGIRFYMKSWWDWCRCRESLEEKLARKGRDLVMKDLDIVTIVNRLHQMERLKMIYLNKVQIEAFDFIEKPCIMEGRNDPKHMDSTVPKVVISNRKIKVNKMARLEKARTRDLGPREKNHIQWRDFLKMTPYGRLFVAYKYIRDDKEKTHIKFNRRLIEMLNKMLIQAFERIDRSLGDQYDHHMVEDMVEEFFRKAGIEEI